MNSRIFLPNGLGGQFIDTDNILYIAAASGKVIFHLETETKEEVIEYPYTLRELEDKLWKDGFLRIHRCFIVNMNKVSSIDRKWITVRSMRTIKLPLGGFYTDKIRQQVKDMPGFMVL